MKKILSIIVLIALTLPALAQSEDATKLSESSTSELNRILNRVSTLTNLPDSYGQLSVQFKQIALREPQSWTPRYFQAYCLSMQAYYSIDTTLVDSLVNASNNAIEVERLFKVGHMDEIYLLRAFNQYIWTRNNPVNRFKIGSAAITKLLAQSEKINPTNPRTSLIRAYSKLITPENQGGGKKNALKSFKDANSAFISYNLPDSKEILPTWGQKLALEMITFCNN